MFRNRRNNARRSSVVKPSTQSVPPPNGTSSRIPAVLQAVFLASNRGKVVHEPPPNRMASRVFFGRKLRTPWGKKKPEDTFNGVERNESSTSSNDDTIPMTISAASSSASSTSKYFQDIVVFSSPVPMSKGVQTEPLKVGTCVLSRILHLFLTHSHRCCYFMK
jgi:hypothetical protein